jgi:hypothetical protein
MGELDWLRSLAGHGLPGDGSMEVEADDRARIARAHEDAMREALLLEEELLRASEVLATAGIDHRVLKGAALAHMIHPDPAERCFGDNDVLVAAGDIDAAVGALLEAGARCRPCRRHSIGASRSR